MPSITSIDELDALVERFLRDADPRPRWLSRWESTAEKYLANVDNFNIIWWNMMVNLHTHTYIYIYYYYYYYLYIYIYMYFIFYRKSIFHSPDSWNFISSFRVSPQRGMWSRLGRPQRSTALIQKHPWSPAAGGNGIRNDLMFIPSLFSL